MPGRRDWRLGCGLCARRPVWTLSADPGGNEKEPAETASDKDQKVKGKKDKTKDDSPNHLLVMPVFDTTEFGSAPKAVCDMVTWCSSATGIRAWIAAWATGVSGTIVSL